MAPAAFSDIAKASNDVDVKSKAPNGVAFNAKGLSAHEGSTSTSLEGKYADPSAGKPLQLSLVARSPPIAPYDPLGFVIFMDAKHASLLMRIRNAGLTLTETWSNNNLLTTKVELDNNIAKGLKAEAISDFVPSSKDFGAKLNLHFRQPNFTGRAFFDLLKGPTANVDAVLGHEGFLVGAEAAYDVQKAAITKYSAAIGYSTPEYSAGVTATNSLSVFAASYYHKVNSQVEAGAKATWDSKSGNNVGMELAGKYRIDPVSFTKAKVNDRGIASLAYNVKLRPSVTLGLGLSLDTQNLNESAHKIGASLEFDG
ncbi:uncharacterized protein KY384_006924 [Bacidia gigantensis]|uniref:uncharacterized protein n=1 Tax=Bacidia gigantensis TaxID=2732470 RepID=UPI001D04DCAB|nr:uncharacterized protein KY384_006924 [Bacidia gigantensis]KAG8528008.1 hypothetical protein KY384_006924 [Bacidia gigantensis]